VKKKIEELLPDIIRKISKGESISTVDIEKRYGVNASSVRAHLRELKNNFYKNLYHYDGSTKKWVAKEVGFLDKILLKPEEVVVLNSLKKIGDNKSNSELGKWYHNVVNNYTRRTSSFIFKQHNVEDIDEGMEQLFAQIHSAIDKKVKVSLVYGNSFRIFYPYKVVNIEHYWYFLGYEESNDKGSPSQKLKTLKMSDIRYIKLLDERFVYDFSPLEPKLEHVINAYFSPSEPIISIYLLVNKNFAGYIDRAKLFSGWRKTKYITSIQDIKYVRYEVYITHPKFKEIIPTILQYMPNILVEDNEELSNEVNKILIEYQSIK